MSRLEINLDGDLYSFGPFVGYYFKPVKVGDFESLSFWCFNERRFYSSDIEENQLLFTGEARLTDLKALNDKVPKEGGRIKPVFFEQAPSVWLESRPKPVEEFLHFHSMYDSSGHRFKGYWLRHVAETSFTYDMGGRVTKTSPLYHKVKPGVDLAFARIVEFDQGPP